MNAAERDLLARLEAMPLEAARTAIHTKDLGADFGGWEGNIKGKPAEAAKIAKVPAKDREHDLLYAKLAVGLDQPASDGLKRARDAGAQVAPLSTGSPLLRVDFLTGVTLCDDNAVAALAPVFDRVAVRRWRRRCPPGPIRPRA